MWLPILSAVGLLVIVCGQQIPDYDWDTPTYLDQYVHSDDGMYSWSLMGIEHDYNGVTVYMINMTSQRYMDCAYVSCCEWWHVMGIAIPDTIQYYDSGALWIGGENNNGDIPGRGSYFNVAVSKFANDTGTVAGYVLQTPNQPCVFRDDPIQRSRYEDDIIAFSWRQYLDDPLKDQTPILRLPMTKAAKRGLDTVNEFAQSMVPGINISKFAVAGASKRGWTAWSIAATDRRVTVAVPLVMSLLNIDETMMYHFRAMDGGYSFALKPYYEQNLTLHFYDESLDGVLDMEDMIRYRSRLTMPKMMVLATGDEFFLNQDTLYWWEMMPGPKWIMFNPNAEHVLFPHYLKIYNNIVAVWLTYLRGEVMPDVAWSLHEEAATGHINMHTDPAPATNILGDFKVLGWTALTSENNTRREFRLAEGHPDTQLQPIWWTSENQDVTHIGLGNFRYTVDQDLDEWVGHFIEAEWEGPDGFALFLTTQVNIIPDTYPRARCYGDGCYGVLV